MSGIVKIIVAIDQRNNLTGQLTDSAGFPTQVYCLPRLELRGVADDFEPRIGNELLVTQCNLQPNLDGVLTGVAGGATEGQAVLSSFRVAVTLMVLRTLLLICSLI